MADTETLLIIEGRRPETVAGLVGVTMLLASGQGDDTQWFDYRPGFYQSIVRVEWDRGTMQVVLPADVSDYLIRNGYARVMTNKEARAYNNGLGKAGAAAAETPQKPAQTSHSKKGSDHD